VGLRGLRPTGGCLLGQLRHDERLRLAAKVDELAYLLAPEPFFAVGLHYGDFAQVEDGEVIAALDRAAGASS